MELSVFPGEAMFLTFKLANGSGWLTSHRLIICKHEPGNLKDGTPEFYFLKGFKKAEIKGELLTAYFDDSKKVNIQLNIYAPSLLEELKAYLEEANRNHRKT